MFQALYYLRCRSRQLNKKDRNFSGLAIYLIYGMTHSKEEPEWNAKRLQSENSLEGIRTWSAVSNSVNMKDEENRSQSQF